METQFNPTLVVLSLFVAILASYGALTFTNSVAESKGKARRFWLSCGALAMGLGIWSMHFIGMLAFEMPGMEMSYDIPLVVLSIAVAVIASAVALQIVSRSQVSKKEVIWGSLAMAVGISGMHYIGMYSMRMAATIHWNYFLVFLSFAIALAASMAALQIAIRLRDKQDRIGQLVLASMLMGFAIAGMHYVGMFAATFVHSTEPAFSSANILVTSGLAIAVIAITLLILGFALAASIGQRLWLSRKKHTDEGLIKSEERFRLLVEAVKDYAIFMLDPSGLVTSWNSGAERITGYAAADVIGQHFSKFYTQSDIDTNFPGTELRVAAELGHFENEGLRVRKDGRVFWANVVITPWFDETGALTGFSKVTRDITLIKENELRLRRLNEELEKRVEERTAELKSAKEAAEVANTTKSAFLANMSHEIRTPLGAILGFSDLIAGAEITPAERIASAEVVKRNGRLLSNIINDILDLSKVEAGKLEIEKSDVPFTAIMTEIGSLLSLEAAEKSVKLTVNVEGAVPTSIKTDPLRLRQILLNIVGNALKFTEKGKVEVTAKLMASNADHHSKLAFVVKDTGEGISNEQAQKLFSPFTQADASTTRRFGGTGLGLVLSKKLAQALGGDLTLHESSLGNGSTFIITIDPGTSNEIIFQSSDEIQKRNRDTPPIHLQNLSVLVVDDSPDNQALITHLLRLVRAQVETANDGREAVSLALSKNFDVILMDLQMPEMDGYEATRLLRARGFTKPIIALTAHAMKEERRRTLENGFDDHLTKPIDRDLMMQTLARYIVNEDPPAQPAKRAKPI